MKLLIFEVAMFLSVALNMALKPSQVERTFSAASQVTVLPPNVDVTTFSIDRPTPSCQSKQVQTIVQAVQPPPEPKVEPKPEPKAEAPAPKKILPPEEPAPMQSTLQQALTTTIPQIILPNGLPLRNMQSQGLNRSGLPLGYNPFASFSSFGGLARAGGGCGGGGGEYYNYRRFGGRLRRG